MTRPALAVTTVPPKLLDVAGVRATIIGVPVSAAWVRANFAPGLRVKIGRNFYWPEPDALRWWQGYLRDRQGAA